jgi:Protein of unknown function (DUF4050)
MPPNPPPSTQEIRAVNRMFAETVRSDWRYPPRTRSVASSSTSRLGVTTDAVLGAKLNPFLEGKDAEPIAYRERFYSSSEDDNLGSEYAEDEDSEEEFESGEEEDVADEEVLDSTEQCDGSMIGATPKAKKKRRSARFETPDSVADFVDRRLRTIQKRKRKLLEAEAQWNRGLCFFLRRRNAWTSAVAREEVQKLAEVKDKAAMNTTAAETELEPDAKPNAQPGGEPAEKPATNGASVEEDKSSDKDVEVESPSPFDPPTDPSTLTDVLIPIAAPILSNEHTVRANILGRGDTELYEKLVRDSRTPAVPINLSHMMRVIVQGWKDEGNWPPKANIPEPSFARRARAALDSPLARDTTLGNARKHNAEASRGLLANHPHLKHGVESFKRVLRLSSGGSPSASKSPTSLANAIPVEEMTRAPTTSLSLEHKEKAAIS